MTQFVWGVLPAVIAVIVIVLSVRSALRDSSIPQAVLSVVAVPAASWALWVLKRIFIDRAWPTFLPHLVIAAALVIVSAQAWLARRN